MKTIENEQKIAQKIFTAATESGLVDNDDFVSSSNLPIEIEKLNLLANALISCKMFDEETPYLQSILDDYTTFAKFKIRLNDLLTSG
jgi:hypothetical protein